MNKLQASQILIKDAQLTVVKLQAADINVAKLIHETKQKQAEVLKLKEVDQERLRMAVQF
jgi:hypothetical protein